MANNIDPVDVVAEALSVRPGHLETIDAFKVFFALEGAGFKVVSRAMTNDMTFAPIDTIKGWSQGDLDEVERVWRAAFDAAPIYGVTPPLED